MTDEELIERLRDFEKVTVGDARDAADRIEALTKELDEANKRGDAWRFRADIAEVKLAIAMEWLWRGSTTLAEIKGESHE